MMSTKTNKLQNQLLQEPDGGDGLDFGFIMDTLNQAPEDLKAFAEALHSLMYDKLMVNISFEDGFVLADRLNNSEIDRLNKELNSSRSEVDYLKAELDSFKRPSGGEYSEEFTENTGWGTEHEAARYRHIHQEVEKMGGWANYRHFMRVKRYQDRKDFEKMKKDAKLLYDTLNSIQTDDEGIREITAVLKKVGHYED
jgi:hypothetical protein